MPVQMELCVDHVHKSHPQLGSWFALTSDDGNPSTSVHRALQSISYWLQSFYRVDAPCLMEPPLLGDVSALANLLFSGAAGCGALVWIAVSSGARSTVDSIHKSGAGWSEGAGTGQVHIHCRIVLRRPFALVETPVQCTSYNP